MLNVTFKREQKENIGEIVTKVPFRRGVPVSRFELEPVERCHHVPLICIASQIF